MKSLSNIGLGLTIVFGCLLLALVAELYYLLWWKRRILTDTETRQDYSSFLYMFCFKKPSSLPHTTAPQDTLVQEPSKDGLNLLLDSELTLNQPRFLFTIVEETKEDLESEDGGNNSKTKKGSRTRSLSDLLISMETPYLTPLSSPSFFTPPLTPMVSSYNGEAEFNGMRNSPPPSFKFLKEAEEKLYRRKLMMESSTDGFGQDGKVSEGYRSVSESCPTVCSDYDHGEEFITIVVDRHKEKEMMNDQQQVLQTHSTSLNSSSFACITQSRYVKPSFDLYHFDQ